MTCDKCEQNKTCGKCGECMTNCTDLTHDKCCLPDAECLFSEGEKCES